MIKVIRQGINPRDVPKQRECSKCKSLLEYLPSDIYHDPRNESYIYCPICGQGMEVK